MIFSNSQLTHNLLDLGFDSNLVRAYSTQQVTPELINAFSAGVAPKSLIAGELAASIFGSITSTSGRIGGFSFDDYRK